jgi:hypothetical protein
VGSNFPISPTLTESFTFSDSAGNHMLAGTTANWNQLNDNTSTPKLNGVASLIMNLTNIQSAGSTAAFLADFPNNGTAEIDFTFNPLSPAGSNLDALAAAGTGTATSAGLSSGEVTCTSGPACTIVPEPASIALLASWGSALAGASWFLRRRTQGRTAL